MEILYHPISGEKLIAHTEKEWKIIEAILHDFKNSQLPILETTSRSLECGVMHE